jgi:hypothetical protein
MQELKRLKKEKSALQEKMDALDEKIFEVQNEIFLESSLKYIQDAGRYNHVTEWIRENVSFIEFSEKSIPSLTPDYIANVELTDGFSIVYVDRSSGYIERNQQKYNFKNMETPVIENKHRSEQITWLLKNWSLFTEAIMLLVWWREHGARLDDCE